jgi:hypothetical protein
VRLKTQIEIDMNSPNEDNSPDREIPDQDSSSLAGSSDTSSWTTGQEDLLKAISERANCMRWLHTQSFNYFESVNFYLTIPNVVISTLNGGFTMSLTSLFPEPNAQKAATTIIGLISIFSAMLITMNQYIKSQQMMESHRSAALSQGKLYRMISNELALRRDQRSNALEFLKVIKVEQDRLENMSPSIIQHIIEKFNLQFKDRDIEKPEIAGDLDEVTVNTRNRKGKDLSTPINKGTGIIPLIYGVSSHIKPTNNENEIPIMSRDALFTNTNTNTRLLPTLDVVTSRDDSRRSTNSAEHILFPPPAPNSSKQVPFPPPANN